MGLKTLTALEFFGGRTTQGGPELVEFTQIFLQNLDPKLANVRGLAILELCLRLQHANAYRGMDVEARQLLEQSRVQYDEEREAGLRMRVSPGKGGGHAGNGGCGEEGDAGSSARHVSELPDLLKRYLDSSAFRAELGTTRGTCTGEEHNRPPFETRMRAGPFEVDVFVPSRNRVIEIVPEFSYYRGGGARVTASARWRHTLLGLMGFDVKLVPWYRVPRASTGSVEGTSRAGNFSCGDAPHGDGAGERRHYSMHAESDGGRAPADAPAPRNTMFC